jgi:hypothetical protein
MRRGANEAVNRGRFVKAPIHVIDEDGRDSKDQGRLGTALFKIAAAA